MIYFLSFTSKPLIFIIFISQPKYYIVSSAGMPTYLTWGKIKSTQFMQFVFVKRAANENALILSQ